MRETVDVDSILMPPPSKRARGGTIVAREEALPPDGVVSVPRCETILPTWPSAHAERLDRRSPTSVADTDRGKQQIPLTLTSNAAAIQKPASAPLTRTNHEHGNTDDGSADSSTATIVDDDSSDPAKSSSSHPLATTCFSDIVGHAAAKLRIDELLLPLALPPGLARSVLTGVRSLPAALLLYGPPGCGKTQLAQSIAGEAQAAFISVGPSDILSKFVGESEASVRSLFHHAFHEAKAVESKCAVLFFDEIDALGHSRGPGGIANSSSEDGDSCTRRVLAELLIQLSQLSDRASADKSCQEKRMDAFASINDSFKSDNSTHPTQHHPTDTEPPTVVSGTQIIVVAATNRPEDCDPALLRRFPIRVNVGLPPKRDRRKILTKFLDEIEHSITEAHLEELALATEGWSGSDLESLTREAAMAPIRECLRSAATMKRRARKLEQQRGDELSHKIKRRPTDVNDEARDKLMSSFTSLRPVSLRDFEDAMEFWLGNQQTTLVGEVQKEVRHVHYDSSSSSEDEDV